MLKTIEVVINKQKYQISNGVTLEEIASQFQNNYKYPILIAKVNNKLEELSKEITSPSTIEFLDLTTREGNRSHISGLTYVLIYAIKKLYGKTANAIIQHSLDKGIYIQTNFKLNENKVNAIKQEMQSIIAADMPITKVTIDRMEAIEYFEKMNDYAKAGVMKYNTNSYVTLYRLGNYYNYFYNLMPVSTGRLAAFDLTSLKEDGFLLQFPTVYIPDQIKPYQPHPGVFGVFKEHRDWGKIIHVENSVDLNRVVSSGKISDLIRISETLQSNRLLNIAKEINSKKDVKIVLIAGPSSSGKTTTTAKLCMYLQSFGLHPKMLSMDDYFVERGETPLDEKGQPDYECLEAVDLNLFNTQLERLLKGEEVNIPTYNFAIGKKEYKKKLKLESDDIILIEGIHAINTNILTNIPRENKYKIYLSALTELNIDDHNRVSTTDNRLLRRIIRDNRTRGYNVEHTLKTWVSVRRGEERHIFPFQDEADCTLNTALIYELGVLKTYAEPLLYSVAYESPFYEEARRLINFLRLFLPIPADDIPKDSVLREFIGNGCFHD